MGRPVVHGGCHPGMPARGDQPGSGCRADCLHRSWVRQTLDELALAEHARQVRREDYLRGARADGEEARTFDRIDPRITLRDAMIARRQTPERPQG